MKLDDGRITGTQLMFAIACFVQASNSLVSFLAHITEQDTWISIIAGTIIGIPLILIFISLINTFPKRNLLDINDRVFGRVAGKIVSVLYILYILTIGTLNLRNMNSFLTNNILVETPKVIILGAFIIVSAFAVRLGVEVILRYCFAIVMMALLVLGLSFVLSSNLMDFNNFLPILDAPPVKYVQGVNLALTYPICDLFIFIMIMPHVLRKQKPIGRYIFGGLLIGTLSLFIIAVRDTAVLGKMISFFNQPSIETLKLVTLVKTVGRSEVLFAIVLLSLYFFKITFLYYVVCISTAQLFGLKSYRSIVLILGVLMVSYAFMIFPSDVHERSFATETFPFMGILPQMLLPLLTFVVAKIRKLDKKEAAA